MSLSGFKTWNSSFFRVNGDAISTLNISYNTQMENFWFNRPPAPEGGLLEKLHWWDVRPTSHNPNQNLRFLQPYLIMTWPKTRCPLYDCYS